MTLDKAGVRARLRIVCLHAEPSLQGRLRALGLGEGEEVQLVGASRRVFYVRTASGGTVALGRETARMIGVEG